MTEAEQAAAKVAAEAKAKADADVAAIEAAKGKKETIEEALGKKDEVKETVGLDKFLDLKKQNKDQAKLIKDLQKQVEGGESIGDSPSDVEALIDEYPDVDPKFIRKMVSIAKTQALKETEKDLAPIKEREKAEKIDKAFKTHFDKAMATLPDYKDVVNPSVIKGLSLLPENSQKTFVELIEETYSKALGGKRTIETDIKPGGGKEPQEVDVERAKKDPKYFKEIMKDPLLKKKYNEGLEKRVGF